MLEGLVGLGLIGGALAFRPDQHRYEGTLQLDAAEYELNRLLDASCRDAVRSMSRASWHLGQARVHARGADDNDLYDRYRQLRWRWASNYREIKERCIR